MATAKTMYMSPHLAQLSLREKQQFVDQAKSESEVLQRHIIYTQREMMDTTCMH